MTPLFAVLCLASMPDELCAKRAGCSIESTANAGTDRKGLSLEVVTLVLDSPEPNAKSTKPSEYWLIKRRDGLVVSTEKVLELANDGNGAAGVGEDSVTMGDNTLTHESSGGSNWRWNGTTVMRLSPLQEISRQTSGSWTVGPNHEETSWNSDSLTGQVTWYAPRQCGATDDDNAHDPPEEFAYLGVPQVSLPPGFVERGWKTANLEACSAFVDGTAGFTIAGKASTGKDASMRVLATERWLFVELSDDVWRTGASNWTRDDHLELWFSDTAASYSTHCLEDVPMSLIQFGIRASDGKVFSGFGGAKTSELGPVERTALPDGRVRMKVALPARARALTVVYSDSDDGLRQKRLIATSRLTFGRAETLGQLMRGEACVVDGSGALTVQRPE